MWSWTFRSIRRGGLCAALLTVGLLAVTMGGLLVAAASQTTLLTADQELRQFWRGSYDILVRPAGARTSIEEKFGLVEANHLSGIAGGISIVQYEAIKGIPGVDVAAPVATLGYIPQFLKLDSLGQLTDAGVYVLSQTLKADPGACLDNGPRHKQETYYYFGPAASQGGLIETPRGRVLINPPAAAVAPYMVFPFLVAGVDPQEEAAPSSGGAAAPAL